MSPRVMRHLHPRRSARNSRNPLPVDAVVRLGGVAENTVIADASFLAARYMIYRAAEIRASQLARIRTIYMPRMTRLVSYPSISFDASAYETKEAGMCRQYGNYAWFVSDKQRGYV